MGSKVNENYRHACRGNKRADIKNHICPLDNIYDAEELKQIVSFYLFHAITLKPDKSNKFGLKSLKDYGWCGNSKLSSLEGKLLKEAHMSSFTFIRADSIDGTVKQMDLDENICIDHPRAVLKQKYKVAVKEDGSIELTNDENRMECLFRHLRNSLAHSCTYTFDNDYILLDDYESEKGKEKKLSARILIKSSTLLEWISIISKENGNGASEVSNDTLPSAEKLQIKEPA